MTTTFSVSTKGFTDFIDITDKANEILHKTDIDNGLVNLFVSGSTAAIITIENDPNLYLDFKAVLNQLAPYDKQYQHHQTWKDDNGAAHIRASLLSPSLTIPIINGQMHHGSWQRIILIDFDTRARSRTIIITIIPA